MLSDSLPVNIGRYEIKSLIGRGGMGDLYLAKDPNTNRLVALKLLNASLRSADLRERFAREARALAALNHPNIVIIYEYGEFQSSPFIVMEYVRGETLTEKIKRQAPLSMAQKLRWMSELCAGLAHAHEAGIIHRDIKPANLMVEQRDRLKILDFGIARVAEGSLTRVGLQMTQVNMVIGTPGYMSPEQIDGREIDHRSDLFAVGTVFYELLSYREAFSGGSTRQIEDKVLKENPPPLESLVRDIDPEIVAIVMRALEKDPDKRYQDASDFEQAMEHQRWRLGPEAAKKTPQPPRLTPQPTPAAGRGSRDLRADQAYQRSLAVYQDGAEEVARRYAIEALAEDPNHLGARALLEKLDPPSWLGATQGLVDPGTVIPQTVAGSESTRSPTVVRGGARVASFDWKQIQPLWRRYRVPATIAASVALVAVLVMVGIRATGLLSSNRSLTIDRPTGGTLLGRGITCGTLGSDCAGTAENGDAIELQAQADPGFVFSGYTGDCAPGGRTIMTAARTCGATFDRIPDAAATVTRALTIETPKGGTIVSLGITCGTLGTECSTSHAEGAQVKLDVLADAGFLFARFTGACAPDGQTVMTEARTCGATFVPNQVAQASPGGAQSLPQRRARPDPPSGGSTPSLPPLPAPTTGGGGGAANAAAGSAAGGERNEVASIPPIGTAVSPPPPTPPDVTAKNEIQRLLAEYCAAYDRLELPALRQVYPAAPDILRDQFRQYQAMQCSFTGPPEYSQLDTVAGKATFEVGVKQAYDLKVGGANKVSNLTAVMTVSRAEARGRWIIDTALLKIKK